MMAMPAARKCGRCGHSPDSPAEWGGDGADRELVLLHAILSIALPQQTAVSRNERNMAMVFKIRGTTLQNRDSPIFNPT